MQEVDKGITKDLNHDESGSGSAQTKTPSSRTWLVMDDLSGFGRAIADAALQGGDSVLGVNCHDEGVPQDRSVFADRFRRLDVDITDDASIRAGIEAAWQVFGHVDVFVNSIRNRILLGAVEEVDETDARELFESNYFSALNIIRAVLPWMRKQRRGHVINLSSAGGFIGAAGYGTYNATKFALEGLSEALANELQPFGIHVTIVEPGYFRTDLLNPSFLKFAKYVIEDYEISGGQARKLAAKHKRTNNADLAGFAKAIFDLTRWPSPPLRLVLGADALEHIKRKLSSVSYELTTWERISLSTGLKEMSYQSLGE